MAGVENVGITEDTENTEVTEIMIVLNNPS